MDPTDGLRVVGFLLGLTCWLAPLVLYRDQEEKIRNKLVDWWVDATSNSETMLRKQEIMSKSIAAWLVNYLDCMFRTVPGRRLNTAINLVRPTALACAWVSAETRFSIAMIFPGLRWTLLSRWFLVPIAAGTLLLFKLRHAWLYVVSVLASFWSFYALPDHMGVVDLRFIGVLGAIAGIVSPWVTRAVCRRVVLADRAALLWFGLLLVLPIISAGIASRFILGFGQARWVAFYWGTSLDVVGNAVAFGIVVLCFGMVAVLASWELAARLLNALYERRGFSRGHFFTLGTLLIGLSLAPSSDSHFLGWSRGEKKPPAEGTTVKVP